MPPHKNIMKRLLLPCLLSILAMPIYSQEKRVTWIDMHIWPPESTVTLNLDQENSMVLYDDLIDAVVDKPQMVINGEVTYLLPYANNHYLYKVECDGYVTQYGSFISMMGQIDMRIQLCPIGTCEEVNSNELYKQAYMLEWRENKSRKANKIYLKAAENGNVMAIHALASNYRDGKGCIKNISKAIYWYKCAANRGDEEAYNILQSLEEFRR